MTQKRERLRGIIDIIPEEDIDRLYVMLSALIPDDVLTPEERKDVDESYTQILKGDYIDIDEYERKRNLQSH